MLFNSYIFLFVFLPVVLAVWWLPLRTAWRLAFLCGASYVFYSYFDWRFSFLMLGTTVVDYLAGHAICRTEHPGRKKLWLVLSLLYNLGMLGFFKYYDFFALSVNAAAARLGIGGVELQVLHLILPIGISFYMFESVTYTIDIYKGLARPANSFLHYALFICIFPKLIAGPIIRYTDVEEQYRTLRTRIDWELMQRGIWFFVYGLVKKLLLADLIAARIDPMFAHVDQLGLNTGWAALLGYSFQIYFDFSAYSDMAVGLGFMLGFRFPQNFNRPYLATNVSDFWNRWHITLSRWLRDYLFIPLGGSRAGLGRTLLNLMITMFLGGLWHGANWTFVIWGVFHGGLLALFHLARHALGERAPRIPVWLSRPFVFLLVTLGWLPFKNATLDETIRHGEALVGLHGYAGAYPLAGLGELWTLIAVAAVWVAVVPEIWDWKPAPKRRWAVALAGLTLACVARLGSESPFLYFQF
ncbi:MAG: MBOAT family O-acyltransferase [Armatimonadota bacterium]